MNAQEIAELLPYLTAAERKELDALLSLDKRPWLPLPGPQLMAYESTASIIGYGGAAGGGKTDLACGKAITQHQKILVLRREATQLTGIIDRFTELIGRGGYNGQDKIWRQPGLQIELGSTPNPDDWNKYQGRPHDLLIFDEAANFLEGQVRALLGWVRSVDPKQRCQALLVFNPPTSADGRWIIEFFAPWLDTKHPNPARPGELRWFATVNGKDFEARGPEPCIVADGRLVYDFDASLYEPQDIVRPMSRTFIPSRVSDNPYLTGTGYMSTLQALPEPLRSQMLYGDFAAGMEDDAMQVIPTAWVEAAQARWKPISPKPRMDSMGVDVARGGRDNTIIARRHAMWFDEALVYAGSVTPNGPTVAGVTMSALRDRAPIHIDVIGVGASPYDFLKEAGQQVIGVNVAEAAVGTDKSGRLTFANQRSEGWWSMREALDPANDTGIALPPDRQLLIDLCAPTWRLSGKTVYVESREDIYKRIGRSPDWASAYILALMDTPRMADLRASGAHTAARREYDPLQRM